MSSVRVNFPQDVSIDDEFIQYGSDKVSYNEVKSIAVYVKQSVTNLTYYTGIPTFKDLSSKVAILLSNGNRIEIQVAAYSEWGPFKNKKGLNLTNDALSFANFIEQKTFNQRMQNYLETGNSEIYFKYQGHEFLKNKNIRLSGKIYASFDSNEYKVTKYFKRLLFEKKKEFDAINAIAGLFDFTPEEEIAINLYHDEDVVLYLLNKL
tara:strand:+ start:116 stop:736 length:621 start_codon:yes stop_codon:yes gene_type:complete